MFLWLCHGTPAAAGESSAVALSERQLDAVTAGSTDWRLDVNAAATGAEAITATNGSLQAVGTTVLRVDLGSNGHRAPRLIGVAPATLVLGSGAATASGTDTAQCSAQLDISGTLDFLTEAALSTTTPRTAVAPVSAVCACAAFGIALGQR